MRLSVMKSRKRFRTDLLLTRVPGFSLPAMSLKMWEIWMRMSELLPFGLPLDVGVCKK